jgi:lysophospholipase L1-like esterase
MIRTRQRIFGTRSHAVAAVVFGVLAAIPFTRAASPSFQLSETEATLSIQPSVIGRTYQLQKSPSMLPGTWENVGEPRPGNGIQVRLSADRSALPACFYRILHDVAGGGIHSIAFMGDSITDQGFTGLTAFEARGYSTWARIFNGSTWDFEPNGTSNEFASGGMSSALIEATHLPEVLASDADVCFVHEGTNDYSAGQTPQQTADRILSHWLAIRNAGIIPIGSSILPQVGNPGKSAWIVSTNTLLRDHAATNEVLFCDWTGEIESQAAPESGVGDLVWTPDNVHPGQAGAARLGRYLARFMGERFVFGVDPHPEIHPFVTRNPQLAGSAGQPQHWLPPSVPVGASLNSKSLDLDPETGGNWWLIDVAQGTASSPFVLQHDFLVPDALAGESVYAVADFEVISGIFSSVRLRCSATSSTFDCNAGSVADSCDFTAADGVITLRTPRMTVPVGNVYATPQIVFTGSGVIQVRRAGLREVP